MVLPTVFVHLPPSYHSLIRYIQDIHCANILWNHDDTRNPRADNQPGKPAVPFHSTFDFRIAFIDFGSATRFTPGETTHFITADHIPPSAFAAPEQSQDEPYDVLRSDVYNVGKVLEHELEEASKVGDVNSVVNNALPTIRFLGRRTIRQRLRLRPSFPHTSSC